MIKKFNFSTSDYHRKLQSSVLLLLLSCFAFVFIPYIVADANAETAAAQLDWTKVTLELDTGSNDGNVAFNGGSAITPDEAGRVAHENKTLTINTTGKHFSVYLSMDASVANNNKLCLGFDNDDPDRNTCTHTGMGIAPVIENNGSPAPLTGNDWGYALNDGETGFSTAGTYINNNLSGDSVISSNTTNPADLALYNAKFAAVPVFGEESLIWSADTTNMNGFGTNVVNGETVTGDQNNQKDVIFGVKVNNNLVAGVYGSKILYTAVASASDLNTPSTNIASSLDLGGPTDVTMLTMDLDAEGAAIKERDINILLLTHSAAAAADSNHDGKFTLNELEAAKASAVGSCPTVARSLELGEGNMNISCVLPELGLNEGTDYDFIVEFAVTGGLERRYISYKSENGDNGAVRYVGLQTKNPSNSNKPYVTTMQGITAGICSMTNAWGSTVGTDARIYNRTGTGTALANTAEASNALGLGTFALEDIRDNKEYLVRRLADGNCWMVQNLDLELADFAESDDLTPSNTDISYGLEADDEGYRASWDPSASYKSNSYGTFSTFSDWSDSVVGMSQSSQFQAWNELGNKGTSGNTVDYSWGSAKAADGTTLATGENVHDSVYVANNQRSQIPRSYSNTVSGQYRYIPTNSLTGARSGYSQQTTGSASDNPLPMTTGLMSTTVANSGNAQGYYGNMYVGNYYNWYTATAESGVYNTTSTLTVEGSAKDSICPKGWQLPINGPDIAADSTNYTDKSWNKLIKGSYGLITSYGGQGSTTPSNSMQEVPLSIILSGRYNWVKGTAVSRGSNGYYWASTPSDATNARYLYFDSTGVGPQGGGTKVDGFTVRCVAKGTEVETAEHEEVAKTCEAGKICYDANGGTGEMDDQNASANAEVMLTAPTYNKLGYAFVGWDTQENGFGTTYQANETITTPSTLNSEGLQLYAKWLPSAVEMQNWSGCSTLGEHQTVALTDNRDGKTYAVRKLKDGNCWMVNNLNLELADATSTDGTTAKFTLTDQNTDLNSKSGWDPGVSLATKAQNAINNGSPAGSMTSVKTQLQALLGNDSTCEQQFQDADTFGSSCYWGSKLSDDGNWTTLSDVSNNANAEIPRSYTYGSDGYYNWYATTAESGTYAMTSGNATDSICPKGWQLPVNSTGSGSSAEGHTDKSYSKLLKDPTNGYGLFTVDGAQSASTNPFGDSTTPSLKMHEAPLSIIFSGYYNWGVGDLRNRGTNGYYWSSTPYAYTNSRDLGFGSTNVSPQYGDYKTHGLTVRCVKR